jgi:hypothetical protein
VRAGRQRVGAERIGVLAGEDDHRDGQLRPVGAQPVEPVAVGQRQVEQQDANPALLEARQHRLKPVDVHHLQLRVLRPVKQVVQEPDVLGVVFDDEDGDG